MIRRTERASASPQHRHTRTTRASLPSRTEAHKAARGLAREQPAGKCGVQRPLRPFRLLTHWDKEALPDKEARPAKTADVADQLQKLHADTSGVEDLDDGARDDEPEAKNDLASHKSFSALEVHGHARPPHAQVAGHVLRVLSRVAPRGEGQARYLCLVNAIGWRLDPLGVAIEAPPKALRVEVQQGFGHTLKPCAGFVGGGHGNKPREELVAEGGVRDTPDHQVVHCGIVGERVQMPQVKHVATALRALYRGPNDPSGAVQRAGIRV
mmetsp:Transcript_59642/g.164876  ORF Transcript_59642/g.164876 Transcript_59642/m.164876 type:complete len:268 (-) Transcript_59642:397-1200(-)